MGISAHPRSCWSSASPTGSSILAPSWRKRLWSFLATKLNLERGPKRSQRCLSCNMKTPVTSVLKYYLPFQMNWNVKNMQINTTTTIHQRKKKGFVSRTSAQSSYFGYEESPRPSTAQSRRQRESAGKDFLNRNLQNFYMKQIYNI